MNQPDDFLEEGGSKAMSKPLEMEKVPAIFESAIEQIHFARQYTLELLSATPKSHWFLIPDGLQTNIAWQVGHLAVSQYGLLMFRIRGRDPEDLEIIPSRFRKAYSRQSTPSAIQDKQPSAEELLERLAEVHQRSLTEIATVTTEVLMEPVEMPYAAYPNKLGAILFCPLHEQIHAGQIGVIRRSLGLEPIR